jgi:Domain of unknown function (DUF4224)
LLRGPLEVIVPKEDLKALTGYSRASAQIRWLHRHGWKFIVNGLGDPVVALAEFNRQMVGGKVAAAVQDVNLEGINDSHGGKPAKARVTK